MVEAAARPALGLLLVEENARLVPGITRDAEASGLSSIWSIEYYNRNSLARLALMAASSTRITVGSAVTAAFARAPLMIATAISDIESVAPGRVVLGLGSSTPRMNREWYGTEADHPAPRLEELVQLLRAIWTHDGGKFEFQGRFVSLKFAHFDRQAMDPLVPIYTAGVNERMIRSAGMVADGFVGHPLATTKYLREIVMPALAKGREIGDAEGVPRIATEVIAAVDDDAEAARTRAALQVAFYCTVRTYDVIFELHGWQEECAAIRAAFAAGDKDGMLRATTPSMLDQMAVYGSAASVAEQLERYHGLADRLILYPPHYGITPEEQTRGHYRIMDVAKLWDA